MKAKELFHRLLELWDDRDFCRRAVTVFVVVVLIISSSAPGRAFWQHAWQTSGFGSNPQDNSSPLSIHVIDVGKADAILIQCEGHSALLDAGTFDMGNTVSDYLTRHNVTSLDYLIMSHPDKDHIGGMAQILQEIQVGEFIQGDLNPDITPDSDEYQLMKKALKTRKVPETILATGESITLGSASLLAIAPLKHYDETNDDSLVLRLEYSGFSALFCGDIEKKAELDLVKFQANLSADLLKVAHHGSNTSSTERFLKAVSPKYAVISVGPDNNNLPRDEVLSAIEAVGAEIYRTDIDGTVVFTYDGVNLTIETAE